MAMRHTLLLLHGFPQDHTLWDTNVPELALHADLIVPDLLGFGSNAHSAEATTMEAMAEDVKRLLDEREVDKVVVCGLSMGGYVALAFAERWPERVEALILCNTRSGADTEEAKAGREETAKNALSKGVEVIARGMIPKVLSAHTRNERADIVEVVQDMMARQPAEGVAAASRGMAQRPDRTALLTQLDMPALVITGESDELMPLPTSTAMVEALPQGELIVLPRAGHLSNLEAPQAFNAAVIGFLNTLGTAH